MPHLVGGGWCLCQREDSNGEIDQSFHWFIGLLISFVSRYSCRLQALPQLVPGGWRQRAANHQYISISIFWVFHFLMTYTGKRSHEEGGGKTACWSSAMIKIPTLASIRTTLKAGSDQKLPGKCCSRPSFNGEKAGICERGCNDQLMKGKRGGQSIRAILILTFFRNHYFACSQVLQPLKIWLWILAHLRVKSFLFALNLKTV